MRGIAPAGTVFKEATNRALHAGIAPATSVFEGGGDTKHCMRAIGPARAVAVRRHDFRLRFSRLQKRAAARVGTMRQDADGVAALRNEALRTFALCKPVYASRAERRSATWHVDCLRVA